MRPLSHSFFFLGVSFLICEMEQCRGNSLVMENGFLCSKTFAFIGAYLAPGFKF